MPVCELVEVPLWVLVEELFTEEDPEELFEETDSDFVKLSEVYSIAPWND